MLERPKAISEYDIWYNFSTNKERDCVFKNMTAKEIFELLGYELVEENKDKIVYEKEFMTEYDARCITHITFHLINKYYDASVVYRYYRSGHESKDGAAVSMHLFAAINKQIKELEWEA